MGIVAWFRGPRVTAKDRAVLDLKRQRDKVRQYQKRIASVQAREHSLAKQCLANGDRKRALLFLKKEQFQKGLLVKTDEQLANLEQLVSSIEFAQVQRDVVFGLEQGAKVLREVNAEMSLEKVERIMDDSADGIAYQEEVEALLSERITRADEDAVERELLQMEREARPQKTPEAAKQAEPHGLENSLPDVPQGAPKSQHAAGATAESASSSGAERRHGEEAEAEAESEKEAQKGELLAA